MPSKVPRPLMLAPPLTSSDPGAALPDGHAGRRAQAGARGHLHDAVPPICNDAAVPEPVIVPPR